MSDREPTRRVKPSLVVFLCTLGTLAGFCLALVWAATGHAAGAAGGAAPAREAGGTPVIGLRKGTAQEITGWGASVVGSRFIDPLADPEGLRGEGLHDLDDAIFQQGGLSLIRVFGPTTLNPRERRYRMMRRLYPRGVRFMLTAEAPGRLKSGLSLRGGAEVAYADFVVRVLKVAARQGTPFTWVAVGNEVDNYRLPIGTRVTAAQSARFYDRLAYRLNRTKLTTRVMLGDNTNWGAALAYGRRQLRLKRVRAAAGGIASHGYLCCRGARPAVGRLARAHKLQFWMTEYTAGCPTGSCPDTPSMTHALRWARRITVDLRAGVNAWFVFRPADDSTHGADEGIVVRQRFSRARPFYLTKRYHVLRQYTYAAPPGSRRMASRGISRLLTLGFARNGGGRSLVVANVGAGSKAVRVDLGAAAGPLIVRQTRAGKNFALLGPRRYGGRPFAMRLPGKSVTTFVVTDAVR